MLPIEIDKHVTVLSNITGLNIKPAGLVATTPRKLLQFVGTDYIRSVKDTYWIDSCLDDAEGDIVITDVRFENELEAIQSRGGLVIFLESFNKPRSEKPEHVSEDIYRFYDMCDYRYKFAHGADVVPLKLAKELVGEQQKLTLSQYDTNFIEFF
jgi:hypothetical protein